MLFNSMGCSRGGAVKRIFEEIAAGKLTKLTQMSRAELSNLRWDALAVSEDHQESEDLRSHASKAYEAIEHELELRDLEEGALLVLAA